MTIPCWPPPWICPLGTLKADSLRLRTELWATCRNEEHLVQGAVIYLKDKVDHAWKGLGTVLVTCTDNPSKLEALDNEQTCTESLFSLGLCKVSF